MMSWGKSQLWQSQRDNDVYWNELVMSPVQVRFMSLKALSQLGLTPWWSRKLLTQHSLQNLCVASHNNQRICDAQNNSSAVFTGTESLRVCRVVYWNELVMSPVQVRVMSLKGLSQLGLYTLVEQKVFDPAFFTECVRGVKTNQRICDTQNNSTAVFTDAEPFWNFRLLWRLPQRCLRQTESDGPL